MSFIINKAGDTIRASRNLRGILDYARDVAGVQSVEITSTTREGNYGVVFNFFDGSKGMASFADWRVAADWVKSRRSWRYGEWASLRMTICSDVHGPRVVGMPEAVARYYGAAA